MRAGLTIARLQREVRQLKEAKGFDITMEQRLAYLTTEIGEVAREVFRLSRDGNKDIETYNVIWNLLDLADMAGADLETAFMN